MDITSLEQEIIRLSRKHNLRPAQIKKIWNYQFSQILNVLRKDEAFSIKVRGLGTIEYNEYKVKKIKQKNDEREISIEESSQDGNRT